MTALQPDPSALWMMPYGDRPDSIRVGPIDWAISWRSDDIARRNVEDGAAGSDGTRVGLTDHRHSRIYIDGDELTGQASRDTLLHETLHAVLDATGLNDLLGRADVDDLEERVVKALSTALLDTLQRNPNLVAYLISEDGA